ncbi:MAG: 3-oxoacyl-ACP reductase FabG [Gemmatimonadota bacterium]|nr:3-oxoacyl-ACP reductase FabG [Gemmatimonadota bacterium]MDE3005577.1 3-oxoacyl-ACP reductase FabG [Gemmatimonadota bacterium]MDE3013329.1 3-oxoacyl-ACP reductase FabG [Gemmatimonadota bacterium]
MNEEMSGAVEALLDQVGQETEPKALFDAANLRGQVAIVTGGSSGIGRAVALELARCGTHVAFCFLDTGAQSRLDAQEAARRIRDMEVKVFFRSCDVRDSKEVKSFVDDVQEELGGVQILVNNAGIGADGAIWRMEDHEWEAVLRTNLDGAFYFTRAVAPLMRAQEHGKIVNITSVHGIRSEFGISNYASSKAGLIGLTQSTAVELGSRNINVNAVAPGYIRTTRLTDGVPSEILDRARERAVLGRLGDPQDVAGVVLFLCSESARHITGAVIPVDAGYLL